MPHSENPDLSLRCARQRAALTFWAPQAKKICPKGPKTRFPYQKRDTFLASSRRRRRKIVRKRSLRRRLSSDVQLRAWRPVLLHAETAGRQLITDIANVPLVCAMNVLNLINDRSCTFLCSFVPASWTGISTSLRLHLHCRSVFVLALNPLQRRFLVNRRNHSSVAAVSNSRC